MQVKLENIQVEKVLAIKFDKISQGRVRFRPQSQA